MYRARCIVLSITILILTSHSFLAHSQNNDQGKFQYDRVKKDTLNGIYIPKDINDCIYHLNKIINDSIKDTIRQMSQDNFTRSAHFSLGMWMRNNWGLWIGSRLQTNLMCLKFGHPDDMSNFILTCYYKSLQGKRINVRREIKRYNQPQIKVEQSIQEFTTAEKVTYYDIDSALLHADKIVEVSFENIPNLSKNICRFTNLRSVNIEQSPYLDWKTTFKTLSRIPQLHELSLYDNNVQTYPKEIGAITQLKVLWIGDDSIKALPPTINRLKNLSDLLINCPNIDLVTLFSQLSVLDSLIELDLEGNDFAAIPFEISKLQQLQILWIGGNHLNDIPQGVKMLQNLTMLSLRGNRISNINIAEGDLFKLTQIDLGYNQFVEFPIQLTALQNLENLEIMYNQIKNIPSEICLLKNLESLVLSGNQPLIQIPETLIRLKKLKSLALDNCPNLNFITTCNVLMHIDLKQLGFYGNKLTVEDQKELNRLLPKTKIYY